MSVTWYQTTLQGSKLHDVSMMMMNRVKSMHLGYSSLYLSLVVRKPVFGVSYQARNKPAVQPNKMARGLKVRI